MSGHDDGVRAAVDIGTNSMRLLIVDGAGVEIGRWQTVTALGRGVDSEGRLNEAAVARTVEALARYGELMRHHRVERARAVATSASRDAANREEFFDRAESALGVRPEVIDGGAEALLAYRGAAASATGAAPYVVVDIGGGSTEFVFESDGVVVATSVDIGSVRLTDRLLGHRPVSFEELEEAARHVDGLVSTAVVPETIGTAIGVAGTWTSLAAIVLDLPAYQPERVHGFVISRTDIEHLIARFAAQTLEETAAIPALDPARAPVILSGAIVARESLRRLGVLEATVSERDLLDGVIASLGSAGLRLG
jgi:exopolyphosphatase/guanosine-5'-triphosphate,3'-diphosphate pyrophosphatase